MGSGRALLFHRCYCFTDTVALSRIHRKRSKVIPSALQRAWVRTHRCSSRAGQVLFWKPTSVQLPDRPVVIRIPVSGWSRMTVDPFPDDLMVRGVIR
jgi:hypothetical protein